MGFNVNDLLNNFMTRWGRNTNNLSNTNNLRGENQPNVNQNLCYRETEDVSPLIRTTGIIVAPTQETRPPEVPVRTTGIVVAPTQETAPTVPPPTAGIIARPTEETRMPDIPTPTTGIVVAPTQETKPPEVIPTAGTIPPLGKPQTPKPTTFLGRVFQNINNIFTSIFRRFW